MFKGNLPISSNKCFHCGGEISEQTVFCPSCGVQLRELPPEIAALDRTEEERLTPMEVIFTPNAQRK